MNSTTDIKFYFKTHLSSHYGKSSAKSLCTIHGEVNTMHQNNTPAHRAELARLCSSCLQICWLLSRHWCGRPDLLPLDWGVGLWECCSEAFTISEFEALMKKCIPTVGTSIFMFHSVWCPCNVL